MDVQFIDNNFSVYSLHQSEQALRLKPSLLKVENRTPNDFKRQIVLPVSVLRVRQARCSRKGRDRRLIAIHAYPAGALLPLHLPPATLYNSFGMVAMSYLVTSIVTPHGYDLTSRYLRDMVDFCR